MVPYRSMVVAVPVWYGTIAPQECHHIMWHAVHMKQHNTHTHARTRGHAACTPPQHVIFNVGIDVLLSGIIGRSNTSANDRGDLAAMARVRRLLVVVPSLTSGAP